MNAVFRSGPADAPRIEWFPGVDTWIDHRRQLVGIENPDDGEITWFGPDLKVVEVTDALDEEMAELVEAAARS